MLEKPLHCHLPCSTGRALRLSGRAALLLFLCSLTGAVVARAQAVAFVEVTLAAGLSYEHGYIEELVVDHDLTGEWIAGGVAAGDYDRDGWVDLYAVRGDIGPNLLFHNRGDGSFEEVGASVGLAIAGAKGSGPTFGDWDGDGWLDLFIGGVKTTSPRLFHNSGGEAFVEVTATTGVGGDRDTYSCSMGDYDRDGDLDLLLTHWGWPGQECTDPCESHLWRNNGDGTFTDVDSETGLTGYDDFDYSFTGNFADLNGDSWPDVLVASDFGFLSKAPRSRVYLNQGDGTFEDVTDPDVITDENGMGAAVGDYDNDGDLDWFVTSIFDAPPVDTDTGYRTGNRLYRNTGDGTFEEVSEAAGVQLGYWGWGACFSDFDNDGFLDIFHVNGFWNNFWVEDPSRLFMSNQDGTFSERSAEAGILDTAQGRGVVCFDYDRDGDVDIFVANNSGPPALYRNDTDNGRHFLSVRLSGGEGKNFYAVGAHVTVTAGGVTQLREVRTGSNFESQQPLAVHFGLAAAETVERLTIRWPDGLEELHRNLEADRFLELTPGRIFADGFESGDLSGWASSTTR